MIATSPPPTASRTDLRTLVDELLLGQQELTAVERFAKAHTEFAEPVQAQYYRSLLPANPPGPGRAIRVSTSTSTAAPAARRA